MSDDLHRYGAPVWSRFRAPRHAGRWDAPALDVTTVSAGTPAGKARLQLQLRREGGRIAEARFQAYGCPVTIAVGEWLAEQLVHGARPSALTAAHIRQALEIAEDKAHCAVMGAELLRALDSTLNASP